MEFKVLQEAEKVLNDYNKLIKQQKVKESLIDLGITFCIFTASTGIVFAGCETIEFLRKTIFK